MAGGGRNLNLCQVFTDTLARCLEECFFASPEAVKRLHPALRGQRPNQCRFPRRKIPGGKVFEFLNGPDLLDIGADRADHRYCVQRQIGGVRIIEMKVE